MRFAYTYTPMRFIHLVFGIKAAAAKDKLTAIMYFYVYVYTACTYAEGE